MATVRIPSSLRSLVAGRAEQIVEGRTVGEVLEALARAHPEIRARLLDERGGLRRYMNVFLNEEDVRFVQGLATPVSASDRLTLVPAMAGG